MKPDISASSEFLPIKYVPLAVPLLGCFQVVAILLVLAFALSGCATIGRQEAADRESLLAQAGFKMLPADTAERQQDLAKMRPLTLLVRRQGAKSTYLYADAQNCRCLYAGGPKEYAEYRRLDRSEEIGREMMDEAMNAASISSVNSGVEVPWDPIWRFGDY